MTYTGFYRRGGWPRFRFVRIPLPGAVSGAFDSTVPLLVWLAVHNVHLDSVNAEEPVRVDVRALIRESSGRSTTTVELQRPCVFSVTSKCSEVFANPLVVEARVFLEPGRYIYNIESLVLQGTVKGEVFASLVMIPATRETMSGFEGGQR